MLYLDERRLGFGSVGMVSMTIFMAILFVLGLLNLLPDRYWIYGIEIKDDGFIFHEQLRKTKFISYSSIEEVIASSMIDGGGWSSTTLRVKSSVGNARLDANLLYATEILKTLKSLPGFNHDAWSKSDVPEDSLLWSAIAKKTIVFERDRSS